MSLATAAGLLLRVAGWILLAPLLPGIVNRVKARVAGRKGPPVLQLYYDLARLWRKGVVLSSTASPAHILAPAVSWVALLGAAMMIPVGTDLTIAFRGDVLVFVYLLALARFCTAWAALETGSAFEGMGSAREVSYAVIAEASMITALVTLAVRSGSLSIAGMLSSPVGPGAALLASGLFVVLLAENSRVPFDDPGTHLELTMIHEVMVLDHSGPPLAAILHGAAIKLTLFALLLASVVLPLGQMQVGAQVAVTTLLVGIVAVLVGLVESLLARYAFRRVPLLLTTAFLLCLFALLITWRAVS